MGLVLEIKAGEEIIVNGALLKSKVKTRLEFLNTARFLVGKQIMKIKDASTPARRVYFLLQNAYVGPSESLLEAREEARALISSLSSQASSDNRISLDTLLHLISEEVTYDAIKVARRLIQTEKPI